MAKSFRFPTPQNRTTISGSTGSGKSQFGMWLLSTRDILDRPWVIFDPKGDDLIAELPAQELPIGAAPPKEPGLYVMRPIPEFHDAWVEKFFWQCWAQEDIGLFIDEGYMVPKNSKAFQALLTQGRSKYIEMIMLTQRPVRCHPMMFSESDFLSIFRLNKPQDRETIYDYVSDSTDVNVRLRLPEYNSYWYDVGQDTCFTLKPAPSRNTIIEAFQRFAKRTVRVL
jgi:hypothetical protein